MITNTRTYTITEQSELEQIWKDPAVEFWGFVFNERTLEECEETSPNAYIATYDTIKLLENTPFTIVDGNGVRTTVTVPAGEYGIKP